MRAIYFNIKISGYFRIRSMSEVLLKNRRLITIDFLNKVSEDFNKNRIQIDRLLVNSNRW